jgi:hypothetical protein
VDRDRGAGGVWSNRPDYGSEARIVYTAKAQRKVYRLTTRLGNGYEKHKDFPPTEEGLGRAMRAWRSNGRNRGTGQQYGGIRLVEVESK